MRYYRKRVHQQSRILQHCTDFAGQKPVVIVPLWIAKVIAAVGDRLYRLMGKKNYLLSNDAVFLSNCFKELNYNKALLELRWRPRPIRETVCAALEWNAVQDRASQQGTRVVLHPVTACRKTRTPGMQSMR